MEDKPTLRALPAQVNKMKGVVHAELYSVGMEAVYSKVGRMGTAHRSSKLEFVKTEVAVKVYVNMAEQDGSFFKKLEEMVMMGFEYEMIEPAFGSNVVEIIIRAGIARPPEYDESGSGEQVKKLE